MGGRVSRKVVRESMPEAGLKEPQINLGNLSDAEVDDEVECGARSSLKMQSPVKPTQEEVDNHYLIHLPFRSWCQHCVRG